MTAAALEPNAYRTAFEGFLRERATQETSWLGEMRQTALDRFLARGFPTTRDEDWRHTSVAPIAKTEYARAERLPCPAIRPEVQKRLDFGGAFTGWEIVFVDGRYCSDLSSVAEIDDVHILCLADVLRRQPERLAPFLSKIANGPQESAFTSLNTAFFEDGALVEITPRATPSAAIHLIYYSTGEGGGRPSISHPRTLIVARPGSQATVVETYAGRENAAYFTNAVTEVVVEEAASLDHYKLAREGHSAHHVATLSARLGRNSHFADTAVLVGGRLVRNDVEVAFTGEGGECTLNGLFVSGGEQIHDTHTVIDHAVPHCTSRELYKGILSGRSRGVFKGRVLVRKDAQKTDAQQTNKNLLLSREALVHSTPQLEILADDVRCKHGSTTGQMDPQALFYLRSRGIGEAEARRLLTYAFASDVVSRIQVAPIRVALETFLFDQLPSAPQEAVA